MESVKYIPRRSHYENHRCIPYLNLTLYLLFKVLDEFIENIFSGCGIKD